MGGFKSCGEPKNWGGGKSQKGGVLKGSGGWILNDEGGQKGRKGSYGGGGG